MAYPRESSRLKANHLLASKCSNLDIVWRHAEGPARTDRIRRQQLPVPIRWPSTGRMPQSLKLFGTTLLIFFTQAGAIYTSGFSLCGNGSLALGGSAVFYQCLSGDFYNLYDRHWAAQCSPIYIEAIGQGSTPAVSQSSEGQVCPKKKRKSWKGNMDTDTVF
jgi:hypothetical protein